MGQSSGPLRFLLAMRSPGMSHLVDPLSELVRSLCQLFVGALPET